MEIKKIMVIGSGQMGGGITNVLAQAGYQVYMNDISKEYVDKGLMRITTLLEKEVKKGKKTTDDMFSILRNIIPSTDYKDAENVDLVIEAATENENIKMDIFRKISNIASSNVILATNTSSISITKIANITKFPQKFIGLHFFNPVEKMKLVEINIGLDTDQMTIDIMKSLCRKLNKEGISVIDSPGFIVNRILIPMINEAIFILNEGISSVEEIDRSMKLGANHPMGPLELADYIGLDTCLSILNVLYDGFKDSKYRPNPLLVKYVAAGRLGKKSGKGFYSY
ncbi:3-hydroxybutyryl-CoA dehydrogenase [Enterococcus casseliflavus]|uniref:3-hydroxybutyryl-CoA dehydrogenase n=1 Tax=Enterococcus casseliflavus TaxID=37734 RepID=UPI002DBF6E26|nr:3-hydroxybutyryl-CoA dehydrogenase [Enterococcus casseliflavus]MEB8418503.1 3-hydroxybutyryl-CoA dehydrogenase [Enterococcus casseliflavus]